MPSYIKYKCKKKTLTKTFTFTMKKVKINFNIKLHTLTNNVMSIKEINVDKSKR